MTDNTNDTLEKIINEVNSDSFTADLGTVDEIIEETAPADTAVQPEAPEAQPEPEPETEPPEPPEPPVDGGEPESGDGDKPPKKSLSKKAKIIIGAAAGVVVLVAALCIYMFGGFTFDKKVHDMTAEQLGGTGTTDTLTRGEATPEPTVEVSVAPTEPEPTPTPSEDPFETLETDPEDPAVGITELPEDVSVQIGQAGYSTPAYTTSYLVPGYDQIKTFVLYGLDEIGISDAIILCTLDPVHHKIKLTSIARDTYVFYSDKGYSSKVNHAFYWEGSAYALKVLNENFSLNIEDYISIDFDSMEDLIDLVGGVEVDVDYAEWRFMNNPAIEIGKTTLDGKFGLKYCRIRTIDSDIVRQSRQHEVLLSIYDKAREISPTYYPALIRQIAKMTTTSFDVSEMIAMSDILLDDQLEIEFHSIPGDDAINAWGGTIYGGWYYIYDLDYASDYIYKIMYEDYYVSGYDAEAVDAYEKANKLGKYADDGVETAAEVTQGINN